MGHELRFEPPDPVERRVVAVSRPLVLFVTGADRPVMPPGTPVERLLEASVAYHVGELVRDCDRERLPLLASFLLDATMAVLVGAEIPKDVALKWVERVAPDAYDVVHRLDSVEPEPKI